MNKRVFYFFILVFVSMLFAFGGYFLVHYSKQTESEETIYLNENGKIDYEVCLKDNEFIRKKCLSKEDRENTYIASLIDYLNLKYDYKIDFDKVFSGSYKYYFKAEVKANKSDSDIGNYYTEDYILSDNVTKTFNNSKSIVINDSIKIDYGYYNDILSKFKNTYGLNMDGKLVVTLEVEVLYTDEMLDREILKTISLPVNIPLTSQVIEIPITSEGINNKEKIYTSDIVVRDKHYIVYRALGYTSFVISALFIIAFAKYGIKYARKVSEYKKNLRKILRTYDGIIVNVKNIPKFDDNVTMVESFNELIDAHSEIRKPINFMENKRGALFYLISEENTWAYELERNIDD